MVVILSSQTRVEYNALFDRCKIKSAKIGIVDDIVDKIVEHRAEYEEIEAVTAVPWYLVAVIHSRESDLNFKTHLHNGDPLTARTIHVPKNRPPKSLGNPPFTFVQSAIDALEFDQLAGPDDTTIASLLFQLEKFNGLGYRRFDINSPYLWSFTNHYTRGKFTSDGKFDTDARDEQCGAATLLLRMYERNEIALLGENVGITVDGNKKAIPAFVLRGNSFIAARPFTSLVAGKIDEVTGKPFTITITAGGKQQIFPAQNLNAVGYVDCSDLIQFIGFTLSFSGTPGMLKITTS